MIEYTAEAMPGTIEVVRPVAPGEGIVRADEDAAPGERNRPPGRPLRPQDLGMLAAAGVTSVLVHARPVVTIFSTGDEVVPPRTADAEARPGAGRHRPPRSPPWSATRAARPVLGGIVCDDPGALEKALREALPASDVIVISAGSSVGRATRPRARWRGSARPVSGATAWLSSRASPRCSPNATGRRPGPDRPAGQPAVGARGVPADRRCPLVRLVGGCTQPPPEPSARATLSRDLASATGRLDVVQVRVREGVATPVFGLSALLSVLTVADGYIVIPEEATGLDAGTEVDVTLYR